MSTKKERIKAQKAFDKNNFSIAPKVSFSEAFPEIDDITVEIREYDVYLNEIYCITKTKDELTQFHNCTNPECDRGGINIGSIIHRMYHQKEESYESEHPKRCRGKVGPLNRKKKIPCEHSFEVKIQIKYK